MPESEHEEELFLENIMARLDLATEAQVGHGIVWYSAAAMELYGLPYDWQTRLGVLAALSPRARWSTNVKWARESLFHSKAVGNTLANRAKAQRILDGAHPLDVLTSHKVRNFYLCLQGDTNAVCIDTWAARAAGADPTRLTPDLVPSLQHCYRVAAREHGLIPYQAQAIAWIVERGSHD